MKNLLKDQSFEIYQSIVNHNPDAIIVLDLEGTIVEANKKMLSLLDYSEDEILRKNMREFITLEQKEILKKQFQNLAAGNPCELEIKVSNKNGEIFLPLRMMCTPLLVKGEITGIFCLAEPILDLPKVPTSIRQIKGNYQTLFNSMADAMVVFDIDGRVIDANPEFEKVFGWSREELVGNKLSFIPEARIEKAKTLWNKVQSGEMIKGYMTTVKRKNGTLFEISATISPIFGDQIDIIAISAVIRDITRKLQIVNMLKESEELYRKVVEYSPKGVIIHWDGRIIYANPFALKTLKEETMLEKSIFSYIHPDYHDIYQQRISDATVGEELPFIEMKAIRADGNEIFVEMGGISFDYYDGQSAFNLIVFSDITDQKEMEFAVKESEQRYRLLADHSLDLIQLVDIDGTITYASPSHQTVLGYAPDDYEGKHLFNLQYGEVDEVLKETFVNMLFMKKTATCEILRKHKSGYDVWVEMKGTPMFDEQGHLQHMMFLGRDITKRKKLEENLEYLSYHDALTGMPNRRLFMEKLEQALKVAKRYNRKLAVFFLDIDHFKKINDTMGHDAGDELLKEFSKRIRYHLRESDILARQGGDEFIILIPEIQKEHDVFNISKRILNSMKEPVQIDGETFQVSTSIGISSFPIDGDTSHQLLKCTDQALYKAKEAGRNTYQTHSSLKEPSYISKSVSFKVSEACEG